MFERETAREKTLLSRMRELSLKERSKSAKAAAVPQTEAQAAQDTPEEDVRTDEDVFINAIVC